MKSNKQLVLSALFLAIGLILPFITGQIPQIGQMLLPMHLPVLLCGFICGWKYGLMVGIICPLLRSLLFSMPPLFPTAISMAFELGTYGLVAGYLANKIDMSNIVKIYGALICAMITGRIVWGIVQFVLLKISGANFPLQAFLAGAFINAIPGIILQLVLIPYIVKIFKDKRIA